MKHNCYLLGIALLVAGALPTFAQVSNDNEDEVYKIDSMARQKSFVPGQVLVKFKDESPVNVSSSRGMFRSASISAVDAVLKEFGVKTMDKLLPNEKPKPVSSRRKAKAFNGQDVVESDLSQLYIVKMNSLHQDSTLQLVKKLQELDGVEFAEPNYKVYMLGQVPNPSMSAAPAQQAVLPRAYSKEATGDVICADPSKNPLYTQQWGITKLKVNELWNKTIINKKRPVIAILDTGVDITHPDLANNIWTNQKEAEGEKNYDNDGNGFKGDVHGWDFINNTSVIRDYNSHGTHVAGIAAACDNEIGIVGANPQALIMPITVMQSDGTGDVAVIAKGIQYAIDNGADIINMSLGTYYNSYTMKQVLEHAYQNAVIVAAAGNDNYPMRECGSGGTMYPAGYSFVLGVQSGQDGNLDGFSNSDCNGPTFSLLGWDIQENYELIAPGSGIISCIPYGKYKKLTGTSMSAPLVAGGISALKMVKEYDTQEILWADLIHMDCNFLKTFNVSERPADIEIMTLQWNDTEDGGNGDGFWDAGETIRFYPVVRTVWGDATNVKAHLEIGEYEDASLIEIIKNDAKLGMNLSTYAHHQFTEPIIFKISENCADARHIKLKLTITCDEAINSCTQEFVIIVDNIVKLAGLIQEDYTLTPSHRYLISEDVAVTKGVNLTIEPGTNIVFREGTMLSVFGVINAHGKPGEMITFSRQHIYDVVGYGEYKINLYGQTVSYCHFKDASEIRNAFLENCIIQNLKTTTYLEKNYDRCNYIDSRSIVLNKNIVNSNIVNNTISTRPADDLQWSDVNHSNYFNNVSGFPGPGEDIEGYYVLKFQTNTPSVDKNENPGYLGTSRSDLVIPHIYQMGYPWRSGFGETDLSNMLTEPVREAHGIVWKVLIDGVDPQDEYEIMPVLGVGRHKFEVYFNRPMNKAKIPNVGFGVRSPYNQNMVDEEGPGSGWNADGTIYTVYKTITGKTQSDGRNRVYIWGAEDDEFFECPYENFRFRFDIQSAGSLATGFAAEAKMGRVDLTWNNENNNFEDAMGFNIYRYTVDDEGKADTICINKEIVDIETAEYTDYDVTPGETYYYMYKVLSTDLQEFDASNVVAVTPLTATLGDADGSGDVKVPDVISTVNYILGENPKPFIFEAADVNTDRNVDVIDVIGIIQMILNQPAGARSLSGEDVAQAVYTIEDGVIYIETPVEIAGLQIQLSLNEKGEMRNEKLAAAADMKGFEVASTWLTENDYRLLAYSFGSKMLTPGKHAIMTIGNADITSLRLSDTQGNSVLAVPGDATAIKDAMGSKVITSKGVWNLSGQKIVNSKSSNGTLPKGVYIIDGQKIVK